MNELQEIQKINREIFNIFNLFFKEGFGKSPQRFSPIDNFSSTIKKTARKRVKHVEKAFIKYGPIIRNFYSTKANRLWELIKNSGGLKYVLGGGSHFLPAHFRSVKSMALYGDTILIPDPVLPWLETERSEEKFQRVQFIEQIFMILHLKPLVDAELPYPAISLFPSWEKALEKNDVQTKEEIERLVTNFFSFYLQIPFINAGEIIDYIRKHPRDFLEKVDTKKLFIAPGHKKESIQKAINHFREYINVWRSDDFNKMCNDFSDAELAYLGIYERVAPQFHLMENSNEFKAHPLSCMEAQWYYHHLVSNMFSGILNSINEKMINPIDSYIQLNNKHFDWLSNLTIKELVRLRKDGVNEEFRSKIKQALDHLNNSEIKDANNVAIETAKVISSLLYDHQRNIREINKKYFEKYGKNLIVTGTGIAASFIPTIAPFAILTAVSAGATLIWNIKDHVSSLKKQSKSLMGILAKYSKDG